MIVLGYFQIGRAVPTTPWEMVMNATLVTKIVLGVLAVLSLLSWAVMFGKWVEFRRVRGAANAFIRSFDRAQSLEEVATLAKHAKASPFTRVFSRAVQFLSQTKPALAASPERTARLSGSQVEALRLVLDAETNAERDSLSRFVAVARDNRLGEPAHRASRYRARRDLGLHRHRDAGFREHCGGGTGYWRSADRHRGRSGRGHSGGVRVQHLREPRESVGQ